MQPLAIGTIVVTFSGAGHYKIIEIDHKNKMYICENDFGIVGIAFHKCQPW